MILTIKNAEADTLALREKLDAERRRTSPVSARRDAIRAIQQRVAAAPLLDTRSDDDIIGYHDHGLPA
jgi:antitoxin VapB